ncbi:MAG: protein kinase, partial [Planctomycetota bacterium]
MENKTRQFVDSVSGLLASSWNAGTESRVEQYLHDSTDFGNLSTNEQREAVLSLLQMEIELRRDSGQSLNVSELAERFPKLDRDEIESLIALPALPPMAGEPTLPDRFEMLEEVGRGGIGSVWRVIDKRMDRELAIKSLLSHFRNNHQANERLRRESLLTGSLQHPGIPPVHEFGTMADGAVYFSMKLVEGQTLANMLANRDSATENLPALLSIFEQVAQTM